METRVQDRVQNDQDFNEFLVHATITFVMEDGQPPDNHLLTQAIFEAGDKKPWVMNDPRGYQLPGVRWLGQPTLDNEQVEKGSYAYSVDIRISEYLNTGKIYAYCKYLNDLAQEIARARPKGVKNVTAGAKFIWKFPYIYSYPANAAE